MKKILLIVVVILTLLPLFHTGLFDVHDPTSILRFFSLKESLGAGQLPASWTNLLNEGYGYPLFLYYAPVFSYLGVLLKLFLPTYLLTLKTAIALMVLTAAAGMYKLMQKVIGSYPALVAAASYTLLPYHATTLYVRGSYAEGATWALLPWVLYLWSQKKRDYRWINMTAICTSLFFLSHNSLPFAFLPFLLLWIYLNLSKNWLTSGVALVLSAGLCTWFLLPVLIERDLVQIDRIAEATNYHDHFLTFTQLWHSPWGYAGSAALGGIDGMSFMLGKFQLVLAVAAIVIITVRKLWDQKILYFLSLLVFFAYMTTGSASQIWHVMSPLAILQFPWRLLSFASFGLAAISGYIVFLAPKKLQAVGAIIIISLLVFFNLKFFQPQSYIPYHDQDFVNETVLRTTVKDKIPEYLPAWMPNFPKSSVSDGLTRTPIAVSGTITTSVTGPLTIDTAYMPQWQMRLNGLEQPIRQNKEGLVETVNDVHSGENTVELTWHRTLVENIGLALSGVSLLAVIGLLLL